MLQYDFDESPGFWIAKANQAYMRALSEQLAPHGITFRQAQVLGWLVADGPQPQAQLATKMLIEPPSLVGVLDRMEHAGLIERRVCAEDRRCKLVHVCPAAKRIWSKIVKCAKLVRTQAQSGLTQRELAALKKALSKVSENVSS